MYTTQKHTNKYIKQLSNNSPTTNMMESYVMTCIQERKNKSLLFQEPLVDQSCWTIQEQRKPDKLVVAAVACMNMLVVCRKKVQVWLA